MDRHQEGWHISAMGPLATLLHNYSSHSHLSSATTLAFLLWNATMFFSCTARRLSNGKSSPDESCRQPYKTHDYCTVRIDMQPITVAGPGMGSCVLFSVQTVLRSCTRCLYWHICSAFYLPPQPTDCALKATLGNLLRVCANHQNKASALIF